ncbi:MAG: HAD family phosphatase [Bacillota bacterium]|nr:HAD family phosphatase [Bacillota bacterium]
MKISGAIFDMDGTLLNSTEMWQGAASRYITSLRKTPEPALGEKTKAMTLSELCKYLKDEYRIATTEEKIAKGFNSVLREDYLESVDIKEYVPILLEKFKQKGIAMCITTSTDKAIADEILARLGIRDYFMHIVTCEESGGGKEDPEVFINAHRMLGTPKEETVVIEDGVLAIRGAKEAGFTVIAIADDSEKENESEIKELADQYIESFEELL